MQEFNFNQHITQLLKADNRLVDEENDIQINVLRDLVNNLDSQLIELLIADDKVREKFFIKVKDVYVFKQNDFIFYLDSKVLDGSYTQYANRIGLASGGKFLTDSTDYVLDFPYKDCVLEGGQSTEEGNDVYFEYDADANDYVEKTAKRKEIFYNNIIAKDEIDRLLEPKAFQKVVRYDANGESIPTSFTRDAELNRQRSLPEDTITDNLVIKGNNLLALHSLEKEFKGKVKLIYIDPPYFFRDKKPEDTFTYNSNFHLSSWLTFMKSRLEIARDLLTNDGVIFISINEDGLCYLKVLLDKIFDISNFIEIFNWKKTDTPSNLPYKSKKASEYIICYEKIKDNVKYKGLSKSSKSNDPLTKPKNSIKILEFEPGQLICSDKNATYKKGIHYGTDKYPMELLDDLVIENFTNINKVRFSNRFTWTQQYLNDELSKKTRIFCSKKSLVLSYKKAEYNLEAPFDLIDSSMGVQTSEKAGSELTEMFGKEVFKYPKSESLIEYLINIVSNKLYDNDIVLDYHLGSGTTASTCHKLGYQYIGVEQMDYVDTLIVPRLQKVIKGEQSGISESVNWQGGGSFVYAELAKNNETAKERIEACTSLEELVQLFEELNTRYFLDYNVRIKDFKENVVKEEAFINLSLARQKEIFKRMLDNNQLYVNLSEVEDARYNLSEDAIRLTKDFYQIKN